MSKQNNSNIDQKTSITPQSVTMLDLVKASFRHQPEKIIVGEISGENSVELLRLMNTGTVP